MIGDLVAKLIEAGTPPEVAAAVVAEAFAAGVSSAPVRVTSADESVTRRREKDRIRQQIRRDNLRTSADLRDNPQMSQNASLSKEDKKEDNQEREKPSRSASRGQRLPDDWAPSAIDHAISLEMLGPDRTKSELEKFRDHWKQQPGSKGVKLDWDAAWRNWIRRAAEFRGGMNGQRNLNETRRSASDNLLAGFARVAANITGDDQPSWDASEEIPSGRVNIDG